MSAPASDPLGAVSRARPSAPGRFAHSILVLADQTATSPGLAAALTERAERGPTRFTLLVPAGPQAPSRLEAAVEQLSAIGLRVRGLIGDQDPVVAVQESWDPRHFDEIIVSTLPTRSSAWLRIGLPQRIRRLTGALVAHTVNPPAVETPALR